MTNNPRQGIWQGRFARLYILFFSQFMIITAQLLLFKDYKYMPGPILWLSALLVGAAIGAVLYKRTLTSDQINHIDALSPRNLLLPWPKEAVFLAIITCLEIPLAFLLVAYSSFPCRGVDLIRKANGCIARIAADGIINDFTFARNGGKFASVNVSDQVQIWSYPEMNLLNTIPSKWGGYPEIALSSNGDLLVISGDGGSFDVFDAGTGRSLYNITQENKDHERVLFSPDDQWLFFYSPTAGVQIFETKNGNLIRTLSPGGDARGDMALTLDGTLLAAGANPVQIWRTSDGALLNTIHPPYSLQAINFSPDGQFLITASWEEGGAKNLIGWGNSMVIYWRISDGTIQEILYTHNSSIRNFAAANDGSFLAVLYYCSNRGVLSNPCIYLWRSEQLYPPTGIHVPPIAFSIAVSPRDNRLVIGANDALYIWETR